MRSEKFIFRIEYSPFFFSNMAKLISEYVIPPWFFWPIFHSEGEISWEIWYYKTTKDTKIFNENIIKKINKKILIKLNCIDYKNNNTYNKIRINCSNNFIIDINNKVIYFTFYEQKFSQEYFPEKIQLYSDKNIYNFVILILKGYCNEINIFFKCR